MKKAIFTIAIGNNPAYEAAVKSFQLYAEKVDATLIVAKTLNYDLNVPPEGELRYTPAMLEKIRIKELLKEYDRILYVDADVIITEHAKNVFDQYPNTDTVYMLKEKHNPLFSKAIANICNILEPVNHWPEDNGEPHYFNAGIMLVSSNSGLFQHFNIDELKKIANKVHFLDQTYFNYLIQRYNLNVVPIDKEFNYMSQFGVNERRFRASFIHYAGDGFAKKSKYRDIQYINDFVCLFADKEKPFDLILLKYRTILYFWIHYIKRRFTSIKKSIRKYANK